MTPERYQRIKSVFFEAAGHDGPHRATVLEKACGPDTELREAVEKLLVERDAGRSFGHEFVAPEDFPAIERAIDELHHAQRGSSGIVSFEANPGSPVEFPSQIAGYLIERQIGTGGMGTVYAARQKNPRRMVALKVMRPGVASQSTLKRFEVEAQVLAHLRHPGIAQIYEAGTFSQHGVELPFFVMEYIPDALTLTEFAVRERLSTRARLELFRQVCEAIQYGHQRGVIHRDLKPSNILVDPSGSAKVIDFGVARVVESDLAVTTMQTDTGQMVGTLQYMSPEQVSARPDDIDVRTDVYSLGVVLYELICARTPYDVRGLSIYQASQTVKEATPARPGSINRALRGDLETIMLKSLEKERERRYQSVTELCQEIERYRSGMAIQARPPSIAYYAHVFARRHRGVMIAGTLALFALIGGFVATTTMYVRANKQARIARAVNEFLNVDLLSAPNPRQLGIDARMTDVLHAASERIEGRFPDDPEVEAAVRASLGKSYMALSALSEAEPHMIRAVELYTQILGPHDSLTLAQQNTLATLYFGEGRFKDTERITSEVLAYAMPNLGSDNEVTLAAYQNLGQIKYRGDDYDEAIRILTECLNIARRISGPESDRTLQILQDLSIVHLAAGHKEDSAEMSREVWDICNRRHGPEHPDTINNAANYATALLSLKRPAEAEPILEGAVEASQKVFGAESIDTLYTMNALARAKDDLGKDDEAENQYIETLRLRRKVLGTNHTSTVSSLINLARFYSKRDRNDEALRLAEEAREVDAAISVKPNQKTILIETLLGEIQEAKGNLEPAKSSLMHAIAVARQTGDTSSRLGRALAIYGEIQLKSGSDDAVPALEEARDILNRELGADHEESKRVARLLSSGVVTPS